MSQLAVDSGQVPEGYRHTEIGVIPKDWKCQPIGEITSISVGKDVDLTRFSEEKDSIYRFPVYSNTVDYPGIYGYYNIPDHTVESVTVVGRGVGLGTAFCRKGGFGSIGRLIVLNPKERNSSEFLARIFHKLP